MFFHLTYASGIVDINSITTKTQVMTLPKPKIVLIWLFSPVSLDFKKIAKAITKTINKQDSMITEVKRGDLKYTIFIKICPPKEITHFGNNLCVVFR